MDRKANQQLSTTGKRSVDRMLLLLLVAAPIILWVLPADYFDSGTSICPSKAFFDFECLGCGMTRAVMHFHHFQFDDAVYYNTGVFAIYPALVALWVYWVWGLVKRLQLKFTSPA